MENKNYQSIGMALLAFISAFIQGCANSIVPTLVAVIIFAAITGVDFFTGVKASKKEGKEFDSGRARKCFNKWLTYLGVFVCTAFLGVLLTIFSRMMSTEETREISGLFLQVLKWEIYIAVAIEVLSIFENLHRWLPDNIYITIIYYTLSIKIKEKFPELKAYFDQKKAAVVGTGAKIETNANDLAQMSGPVPVDPQLNSPANNQNDTPQP